MFVGRLLLVNVKDGPRPSWRLLPWAVLYAVDWWPTAAHPRDVVYVCQTVWRRQTVRCAVVRPMWCLSISSQHNVRPRCSTIRGL